MCGVSRLLDSMGANETDLLSDAFSVLVRAHPMVIAEGRSERIGKTEQTIDQPVVLTWTSCSRHVLAKASQCMFKRMSIMQIHGAG